jgi:hypothetical protein
MAPSIAGIRGVTVAGGVGVITDINGHLGTTTSSERFKEYSNLCRLAHLNLLRAPSRATLFVGQGCVYQKIDIFRRFCLA